MRSGDMKEWEGDLEPFNFEEPIDLLLRRFRRRHTMTQKQLGVLLGVHVNSIAKWERAAQPVGKELMLRMALAYIEFETSGKLELMPGMEYAWQSSTATAG